MTGRGTVICVCGAGRSGTTMLDLMLGNGPDAFSIGEAGYYYQRSRGHHSTLHCSCEQPTCEIWERLGDGPPERLHARVLEDPSLSFVVDSTKKLSWVQPVQSWAPAAGLEIVNVVIWKHPLELAWSFFKRDRTIDEWRREFVSYYETLLAAELPFVSISYDRLVTEPARSVRALSERIGLRWFEGKERFWEKQHHFLFGSGTVRKQLRLGLAGIARQEVSPAFVEASREYARQLEQDEQIAALLDTLEAHQIDV